MKTKPTHTPTPWIKAQVSFDRSEWSKLYNKEQVCVGRGLDIIAIVYGPDDQEEANAAFIVRAVNAHEELLKASQGLLNALQARLMRTGCNGPEESAIKALRQAIAKAEAAQ